MASLETNRSILALQVRVQRVFHHFIFVYSPNACAGLLN